MVGKDYVILLSTASYKLPLSASQLDVIEEEHYICITVNDKTYVEKTFIIYYVHSLCGQLCQNKNADSYSFHLSGKLLVLILVGKLWHFNL